MRFWFSNLKELKAGRTQEGTGGGVGCSLAFQAGYFVLDLTCVLFQTEIVRNRDSFRGTKKTGKKKTVVYQKRGLSVQLVKTAENKVTVNDIRIENSKANFCNSETVLQQIKSL